jgi:hypothetical protein
VVDRRQAQQCEKPLRGDFVAAGLGLALATLLGACTEPPAESVPMPHLASGVLDSRMTPAPPYRSPPPPVAGAISIRFLPEGAVALNEVAEVVADATVSGGAGRLRLWVDFVEPGGITFQRSGAEVDALPAGAKQSVALRVPINGTDAARFPGTWTAVLIGPDGPLADANFALKEEATP